MKIKNVNLKWYALHWDSNEGKLKDYNILYNIEESIAREVRSGRVYNKSILREYLKTKFMYHYWSKAECEILVSDLSESKQEKIDMWRQIQPNLDLIVDYVNDKMKLNFK